MYLLRNMQAGQLSADTICPNPFYFYIFKTNAPYIIYIYICVFDPLYANLMLMLLFILTDNTNIWTSIDLYYYFLHQRPIQLSSGIYTKTLGLNNIPEAVNIVAWSAARLCHSSEIGWNKHNSSYYAKQNSMFYHRVKL